VMLVLVVLIRRKRRPDFCGLSVFSPMTVHQVLGVSLLLVPNSDYLSRVPEFGAQGAYQVYRRVTPRP